MKKYIIWFLLIEVSLTKLIQERLFGKKTLITLIIGLLKLKMVLGVGVMENYNTINLKMLKL